jgi:hypothetical protein
LGEGTLQSLLDGELPPAERADAEAHLGACPPCAAELRALRGVNERAASILARGDLPAPVAQAQMALRARRMRASRFTETRRAMLRAAVLVLGLAGVAAAAVPGSPVRQWISDTLPGKQAPERAALRPAPPPAPAPAPVEAAPSGVRIAVEDGAVHVVLTRAAPGVEVVAQLVDDGLAGVLARPAGARFRTGPGRIEVVGAREGSVEVRLPRGVPAATVEVNGRVRVTKQGESLVLLPPAAPGGPSVRVGG